MSLIGSYTERNLLTAFAGESQARNRYTYFASQARKDGYIQIANIFEETADQEKEHAKRFFKLLPGGEVKIECAFPAGVVGTTAENLLAAANGEHEEWSSLYPGFANVAREEGLKAAATIFDMISVAEKQHERRFRGLLENVQNGGVFKRSRSVEWRCLNCGYVHESPEAPAACPACAHPQAYFEVLVENW
jgi:rubrerythrin